MKNFKKLTVLFLALFVFAGMMSCDMNSGSSDELAVIGNWDAGYDNILEITPSMYKKSWPKSEFGEAGFYSAKIVSYDNTGWNGSDSGMGEGEYGYFVLLWDNPSKYTPQAKDKYSIVRWKNLKTTSGKTTMEYSEAYKSYFDTAAEAIEGSIEDKDFFTAEKAFTLVPKLDE